jgi:hypothetical protein
MKISFVHFQCVKPHGGLFFGLPGELGRMSKLMPRLDGHMRSYRTATMFCEDGAEAVEQEFKP